MKPHHLAAPLIMFVSSALAFPLPNAPRPSAFPGLSRPADLPVVYLTDFELNAVPPTPARLRRPNSAAQQTDDEPSAQAIRLVKFLSLTLSNSLKTAGYTVQPFPGSGRPDKGLLIRGVFTEPDEYNRVRRTILGSGSKSAKFVVYIGVNNLASPEQPLYQLVAPNTPGAPVDTRFGPLITITSYGPVTSFELERRPSDDAVKRMAEDIVAKLSALVTANPQLAE